MEKIQTQYLGMLFGVTEAPAIFMDFEFMNEIFQLHLDMFVVIFTTNIYFIF